MFDSRVNTIRVPIISSPVAPTGSPAPTPATIIKTAERDCVVRVRNISFGSYVLIAYNEATISTFPAMAATYRLPAGATEEFIAAKGQSLFVSTPSGPPDGSGAAVSVHIFQRLPVEPQ
jgi:hypothetical protein